MDWYEVSKFKDELRLVRQFLFEAASRQEELDLFGLSAFKRIDNFEEAQDILRILESKLYSLERTTKFVAPEFHDRLSALISESPLIKQGTEFALSLELQDQKKQTARLVPALHKLGNTLRRAYGISLYKKQFADSGEIPLRRMLTDLDRLLPLVSDIADLYFQRTSDDNEIFEPSRVNPEDVRVFIDKAIIQISAEQGIDQGTRDKLVEYLSEANAELGKSQPAWKRVIGALIITSTILGGLAVAPEALNNVEAAVRYILGTSIQLHQNEHEPERNFLPPAIDT
ncbi:hypothetical protein [Ruegeria sp. HKCCSP351]|uniref:hypothetical protein n=1 Tax=Ruegeria sp. HKCCSP351 TaxID=2794832 RepID=UPI001AE890AD|nr:hypothetical protein [Ruegeria sp. HKCCSP351]